MFQEANWATQVSELIEVRGLIYLNIYQMQKSINNNFLNIGNNDNNCNARNMFIQFDQFEWRPLLACVSDPHPTWFMTIFCDGYCFNAINVVLDTITRDNYDNDPCDTYLYLESLEQEYPYNKTMWV